jgi:hypothetical protein
MEYNSQKIIQSKIQFFLFFILLPSLLYFYLATNFTFNIFEPSFLWKAYNEYYLSIISGRLDIPAYSIGLEGGFNNQKSYMYYGALPAFTRSIFHFFVDLKETPIAIFSILFFSLLGTIVLQYSIRGYYLSNKNKASDFLDEKLLIVLIAIIWFASAPFTILQSASIYHEPYAASLCVFNLYMAYLLKKGFFLQPRSVAFSLIPLAILAGLSVHTRVPMALNLYALTLFLLYLKVFNSYSENKPYLKESVYILAILFVFGLALLSMNDMRTGNPLNFMSSNYGYFLVEGFSDRRCNIFPNNELSFLTRLIPNIYIYLTGDKDLYWSLSYHLQTGFGRREPPYISIMAIWTIPLIAMVYLFCTKLAPKNTRIILIAVSLGGAYQLIYPTIAHRYIAEFWPILLISIIIFFTLALSRKNGFYLRSQKAIHLLMLVLALNIGYELYLSFTNKYYTNDGPIYSENDYHYSKDTNAFLSSLTNEKIQKIRNDFTAQKDLMCKKN